MARRKKNDTFELLWQGLVVLPALLGLWLGFQFTHSIDVAGWSGGGTGWNRDGYACPTKSNDRRETKTFWYPRH